MKISKEDYSKLKLLEERLWQSDFRFDISKMEKVLAQDFFEFGRSGQIYQRVDTLKVTSQEIPCVFPLIDLKIRLINESTAQITYISIVNYLQGEEKSLTFFQKKSLVFNDGMNFGERTLNKRLD